MINQTQVGPAQSQGPSPVNWQPKPGSRNIHSFIHEIISAINMLDTALADRDTEIYWDSPCPQELTLWKGDRQWISSVKKFNSIWERSTFCGEECSREGKQSMLEGWVVESVSLGHKHPPVASLCIQCNIPPRPQGSCDIASACSSLLVPSPTPPFQAQRPLAAPQQPKILSNCGPLPLLFPWPGTLSPHLHTGHCLTSFKSQPQGGLPWALWYGFPPTLWPQTCPNTSPSFPP